MKNEKTSFDDLTDRQLIEHLLGRVETLEGAVRAHRATLVGLMRVVPRNFAEEFWKYANSARAEVLTVISIPDHPRRAPDIREIKALEAADQEFLQLKELLATIA